MPETFSPLTWRNDQSPALNDTNLNRLEVGVEAIDDRVAALENGVVSPVVVPYATSVTLNATQGSLFRCVAAGDLTLDDIVGGADGQTVVFEVQASDTARALHFTGVVDSIDIAAGQWWVGVFRYVAVSSAWLLDDSSGGGGGGGDGGAALNILAPQNLPYAATITPNAASGALFRITAPGDFTLANPINGTDGQAIVVEVLATGGTRTVSFTAGYPSIGIPSGSRWTSTLRYNATLDAWLLATASSASSAVSTVNGFTGAVALKADDIPDGATKVQMTSTERTKLAGVATGATAYTGENARDDLAAALVPGANITITPNDGADTITIAATGSTGYATVQDEGTARTARGTLNFVGAGVTATDDAAGNRTLVTIPGATGGGSAIPNVVWAAAPPSGSGLNAVAANGSTNDAATVQAHLDYVKSTWGSGVLVLPAGKTLKMNSGITIPTKVRLDHTGATLDFSALSTTTGVAITINDSDWCPLVGSGGLIIGPSGDPRTTPTNTADVSIGVKVTGARLDIIGLNVRSFGRGVRTSYSNTWSLTFRGGGIYQCYYNIWADNDADVASNAGESIVFDGLTIYNAVKGMRICGNGVSAFFNHCRIDYLLTRFGEIEDARVHFTNCHIEVGNTQIAYLFDVDKNAHVDFSNTYVLMGAGSPNITHFLFNPAKVPWNINFGGARFANTKIFYVNPSGTNSEQRSELMVDFPSGTTTSTFHTPYPIRWGPVTAEFCSTDSSRVGNFDQAYVTWTDAATGNITVTASASAGFTRKVRVKFG